MLDFGYSLVMYAAFFAVGLVALALVIFLVAGLPAVVVDHFMHPREGKQSDYVAEVWLNWEICPGSTLYRQRFRSKLAARIAAKLHAVVLDACLPTSYASSDWSGRRIFEKYEFEIRFGVRKVTEREAASFRVIWSTVMPGEQEDRGEHAMAHPLRIADLSGSLDGYKF